MSDVSHQRGRRGIQGPWMWVASLLLGSLLGWGLVQMAPPQYESEDAHQAAAANSHDQAHDESHGIEIASAGDELDTTIGAVDQESHGPADTADGHEDSHEGEHAEHHGPAPAIPLWLVVPFAVLLGSIALMPFINEGFWHHHFPDFAFFLGGITLAYYLFGFSDPNYSHGMSYGAYQMKHVGLEYVQFIALIGGLYVASGGILINVSGRGTPVVNTGLLAVGAVIANIVGTTGASVLLIRPFMRVNKGRLKPIHVVMFIFIVSNCGGALTPIGDPPLYLGFLKGVPFFWTLTHLWPMWAVGVGMLLGIFFVIDTIIGPAKKPEGSTDESNQVDPSADQEPFGISIKGMSGIIALSLIIAAVFLDPMLKPIFPALAGIPVGAMFQLVIAAMAYKIANQAYHEANEFTFFPVKEVGLLFVGIFATMAPALGYLASHGAELGLDSPTKFYFATGALSGVLDNAPTYLNFLQVALSAAGEELNADGIHSFIEQEPGTKELMAISLGAVFFGAMTYIGNGPNFMVRAIAEAQGLKMPSFFGFMARAIVLLLPVLLAVWLLFFVILE